MSGITQTVVSQITDTLGAHGAAAVFGMMIAESSLIPIPSEVIMLFAGYLVAKHGASLPVMIGAGTAGNVVGSWIGWALGAFGGRRLFSRYGKWIHFSQHEMDRADRWFSRYGARVVLIGRVVPLVRTYVSLPAGFARVPLVRFTIYTAIGCCVWVTLLASIGVALGPHWENAESAFHYLDYLVAAVVVVLLAVALRRWLRRRSAAANSAAADIARAREDASDANRHASASANVPSATPILRAESAISGNDTHTDQPRRP